MASIFQDMTALAVRLGAINLAQGIPEPLNDAVLSQSLRLSADCDWQYADTAGDSLLRAALCRDYQLVIGQDQILITSGCTESLLAALHAARRRYGDAVAALEPFYPYYRGFAEILGLRLLPIGMTVTDRQWRLDEQSVGAQLEAGVRILLVNSPHNPTGWVLDEDSGARLLALCRAKDALLIIDNVYADFVYDRDDVFRVREDHLDQHCVVASSVSKMFAASGLRLGWLLGPASIVAEARTAHMHMSNCQPLAVQVAVRRMLEVNDKAWRRRVRAHYRGKRDLLFAALASRGFDCTLPSAGHFIVAGFDNISDETSSMEFAYEFAKENGIVGLPMHDFYREEPPRTLRFSFAVPKSVIERACRNLMEGAVS
jgi:aspartate/methionine/tyrosine aminotransferase